MVTMVARPVGEALLGAQSRTGLVYIVYSALGWAVGYLLSTGHKRGGRGGQEGTIGVLLQPYTNKILHSHIMKLHLTI